MSMPEPIPICRIMHIENLKVCMRRGGFHFKPGPGRNNDKTLFSAFNLSGSRNAKYYHQPYYLILVG